MTCCNLVVHKGADHLTRTVLGFGLDFIAVCRYMKHNYLASVCLAAALVVACVYAEKSLFIRGCKRLPPAAIDWFDSGDRGLFRQIGQTVPASTTRSVFEIQNIAAGLAVEWFHRMVRNI